jgi:hypothetical protein
VRKLATAIAVVSLMMAVTGVASASAAQWSPQNSKAQMTNVGPFAIGGPILFNCSTFSFQGKTTGSSFAGTGPQIASCAGQGSFAIVNTSGNWSINATSTTTASLTADTSPSGGNVLTITWGSSTCAVKGPIKVTGLPWDNATHTLTLPTGTALPNMSTGGICPAIYGSALGFSGKFVAPSLTITP